MGPTARMMMAHLPGSFRFEASIGINYSKSNHWAVCVSPGIAGSGMKIPTPGWGGSSYPRTSLTLASRSASTMIPHAAPMTPIPANIATVARIIPPAVMG